MRYYHIAIIGHIDHHCEKGPATFCYEELSSQGHGVVVLDPELYPGLFLDDGALNEPMLGAFRATFQPDYVAYHNETANEILEILAQKPEAGYPAPPEKFVIFGYIGRKNFGDELILWLFLRELSKRHPGSYAVILGHIAEPTLRTHGCAMGTYYNKDEQERIINGAKALVFIAGLLVDPPFRLFTPGITGLFLQPFADINGQVASLFLASTYDVPSVFLGVGAGPLSDPSAQAMLRLGSLARPHFLCRDKETAAMVTQCGIDETLIETYSDMACLLSPEILATLEHKQKDSPVREAVHELLINIPGNRYIVVSLREIFDLNDHSRTDLGGNGLELDFIPRMARLLDRVISELGLAVIFVDFQPDDQRIHEEARALMKQRDYTLHVGSDLLDETAYLSDELFLIKGSSLVFAMRLHASISASMLGIPCIGLNYNEKVSAFYHGFGLARRLVPMDFKPDEAFQLIQNVVCQSSEESAEASRWLLATGQDHRIRAQAMMERFDALISQTIPRYRRPTFIFPKALVLSDIERLTQERDDALQRLEETEQENDRLLATIREIYDSRTWKMGDVLLALPKALKDRILKSSDKKESPKETHERKT